MTTRIEVRLIYQAISLVLVGLIVVVTRHDAAASSQVRFELMTIAFQALPAEIFAFLPFALVLSTRGGMWRRPAGLLSVVLVALLLLSTVSLLDTTMTILHTPRLNSYLYVTGLRSFACCLALATLLARRSTMLARVPANAYRAAGLFVLAEGAGLSYKNARIAESEPLIVFLQSYTYVLMLGVLILVWTEARLPPGRRISATAIVAFGAAAFSVVSAVVLGWKYPDLQESGEFWSFVFGFLPSTMGAMLIFFAALPLRAWSSRLVLRWGRVVAVLATALSIGLARWFAFASLPGASDEGWQFLALAANLGALGLLLLVQIDAEGGRIDLVPSEESTGFGVEPAACTT